MNNTRLRNNSGMSDQQRIDPFELPDPDEWDEGEKEEYRIPKPGDYPNRPDPFECPEDLITFDDELHDKWDLTSQPLNWR